MTLYALLAARWTADQTTETLASFLDHTPLKPGDRVVVSGTCPEPPPGVAVLPTWADRQGTRLAELAAEALAEGRDLVAIIAPASLPAGWTAVLDHEAAAVVVLADSRYGPGLPPARLRLPHAVMARLGPLDGGFEGGVAALLDYRLKALRTGFPTRCLDAGPYPPPYLDTADAERLRRHWGAAAAALFLSGSAWLHALHILHLEEAWQAGDHIRLLAVALSGGPDVPGYFWHERPLIASLVPVQAHDILDVGCAAGRLGLGLKRRAPCRVSGIEIVPEAARIAATLLDEVHCGDASILLPSLPEATFDAVVMADVIEHVADSEGLLATASRRLRPGGTLVLSVPNVQYWPVLKGLLEGHWTYTEAGVLDRTHLRFFTRESLIRLIHGAGLEITGAALQHDLLAEAPPPDLFAALRGMGLTVAALERDATVAQFVVACRRS